MRKLRKIERWKVLQAWPDYAISNFGRVKRLTSRTRAKAGTILKNVPRSKTHPYPCVSLCGGGKKTLLAVHQLVMLAFRGAPPPGHEINHCDGDKTNPPLSNLEYRTRGGNILHSYEHGLQSAVGEQNGRAKLDEATVIEIRKALPGARGAQARIADDLGISRSAVRDIVKRRTWAHI